MKKYLFIALYLIGSVGLLSFSRTNSEAEESDKTTVGSTIADPSTMATTYATAGTMNTTAATGRILQENK